VSLETGVPYDNIKQLVKMGHRIQTNLGSFGGYQAIQIDPNTGVYYAASESRKDGQAAGY
jgi:gamma-glutamyltranspeptidase/glutathione hydrolase